MKIRKIAQTPGVVATVVDNLESESAVDALSAKQGKELKNLIENIGPVSRGALENFPIGTTVQYDGDTVPEGWEAIEIDDIKVSTDEPVNGEKVWIKKSKNLWNAKQVKSVSNYIVANGTGIKLIKTSTGRVSAVYDLKLKAGKTYCISCKRTSYTTTDGILYCIWYNKAGGTTWVPNLDSEKILFTPTEDIYRVQFYLQPTEADGAYVEIEYLQVEEGTEATAYQPYEKQAIYIKEDGEYKEYIKPQIKIGLTEPTNEDVWIKKGKNILKLTPQTKTSAGVTATINYDGSVTLNGTATGEVYISIDTEKMYVEGAYTFGLTTDISDYFASNFLEIGCYVYDTDGKYNRDLTTKATPTQTIEKGEFISLFSIYCNKGAVYNNFKIYPQIEAGTQATAFESYANAIYVKNANGIFEKFM